MGECGASISQTLCIPPDGSGGDHLCVLCSTTYSVCTCVSAHAPPLCHRAMYLLLPPRSTKHLLQIISREKNSRNKVRTGETLKNRILLLRERKRKNRKRATTIIVETFAGETFLSTRLLHLHLPLESQTRPHPDGSRIPSKNPSSPSPRSTPLEKNSHASVEPVEKASAKCPASRSPVVFAFIFRERSVFARLATAAAAVAAVCVRACSIRCVGAESRPRERIQM